MKLDRIICVLLDTWHVSGIIPNIMRDKSKYLEEQIIKAIRRGTWTTYSLAKESGVHHSIIVRFLNGERNISLSTASKLVNALSLELKPRVKRRSK